MFFRPLAQGLSKRHPHLYEAMCCSSLSKVLVIAIVLHQTDTSSFAFVGHDCRPHHKQARYEEKTGLKLGEPKFESVWVLIGIGVSDLLHA